MTLNLTSAGSLEVSALSNSSLDANVSNESTAAASALIGASSTSYSGILSNNAVSGGASASITNADTADGHQAQAENGVLVSALDTSEIDSTTSLVANASSSNDLGAGI